MNDPSTNDEGVGTGTRPIRRGGGPKNYRELDDMVLEPEDDVVVLVDTDDEEVEEAKVHKKRPVRSKSTPPPSNAVRKSSRSTQFRSTLAECLEMDDESSSAEEVVVTPPVVPSPHKSPARRHVQQRRSVGRTTEEVSDSSASEDSEEYDEEEDDEPPLRIQRILASRSETLARWKEICKDMNTSEIHYGSRWYQEADSTSDDSMFQERFLVQWSDLSHLHVSWETEPDLIDQVADAKPYLTTFFRKAVHGYLYSPDERCDGEYFDPAYREIDRILEVTEDEGEYGILLDKNDPHFDHGTGRQFLIKWRNLPYADMTYEFERDLIMNDIEYKDALQEFEGRTEKPSKTERRSYLKDGELEFKRLYKIFGNKSTWGDREAAVDEYKRKLQQHVYKNGGQLRDYQAEGVAWMLANFVNQRNSILADEMGLGKTLQTAAVADILANTLNRGGPVLIVAPLSTLTHWHREFLRWTDLNAVVYHGSAEDRKLIREHEFVYPIDRPDTELGFNQVYLRKCAKKQSSVVDSPWMVDVVITSPEMMIADDVGELTAVQWEVLVVDEAHRMKNYNSKLSVGLRNEKFTFRHRMLLTGTPIQNDVQEFWALLNFIDEESFSSLDDFMASYGEMQSKERVDELHEQIRPYILRRLKEDVEKSVPPKEETLIEVELTVVQKQYYRALYEKNVKFLHKNNKKSLDGPSLNNLAMQLRKCCNHVFLLNGVESEFRQTHGHDISEADFLVMGSGKLILLDKLLPRLKEEGHRVLLFSQFKIMLDILEDYLKARGMQFERIDGSITGRKRQQAIDRFQAPSSETREAPFIMLLSTRAGGVGITLTAADTCIIVDSDWNPQNDLQAQARCHRIGQTKSVKVYRLLSRKTYEMQMFHMSSLKMGLDQVVLKGFENGPSGEGALTKAEVERLLRVGAYDIFNEEKTGEAEAESNNFVQQDIDSIMQRRSHTIIHENTGSQSSAAGGTFSKASFKSKTEGTSSTEEDVDIEDPDFWKKMIGERHVGEGDETMEKRRTRAPMNYSEQDYHRELDSALKVTLDDGVYGDVSDYEDDNQDDEKHCKAVNFLKPQEPIDWGRGDIENIVKSLSTFGYGRLSWFEFMKRSKMSKLYDEVEFVRMCWTIIFTAILEAVEDSVETVLKRESKRAEKVRELAALENGGVLSVDRSFEVPREDVNRRKLDEFKKVWNESSEWIGNVIKDANTFASSNPSRTTTDTRRDSEGPGVSLSRCASLTAEIEAKFNANVWPSLKNRGWKSHVFISEECKDQNCTRYFFRGNEYCSIDSVMAAGKVFHPEISNILESLNETSQLLRNMNEEANVHVDEVVRLSERPVPEEIQRFLELFGSLQLLHDRQKSSRVRLPRTVFSSNSVLCIADTLVRRAEASAGTDGNSIETLAQNLSIDKRTVLPHPFWTTLHDSVLIHAIVKHGWIDQDAAVKAIANDVSIKWGAPFETSSGPAPANSSLHLVSTSAERVAFFFNKNSSMISELKGFNVQHVITVYRLRRMSIDGDVGSSRWVFDGFEGTEGHDKAFDLPSKKDLVRRAKALLGKNISVLPNEFVQSAKCSGSYGFTILDQRDGSNVFLAEILRAILKEPANSIHIKALCSVASEEARFHALSLQKLECIDASNAASSLLQIAEHIDEARGNISKLSTQSKNIIRVVLGEEVLKSRTKNENLFPPRNALPSVLVKPTDQVKATRHPVAIASPLSLGEEAIRASCERKQCLENGGRSLGSSPVLNLELTEIETIILSAACSVGIPVWIEEWETKLEGKTATAPALTTHLTWKRFGKVVSDFSEENLEQAATELKSRRAQYDALAKGSFVDGMDRRIAQSACEIAANNLNCKEMVAIQAREYMLEPETLAKKAIMLLEKLRRHMGVVIVSLLTTRSDNGLGSKVLVWFRKELLNWATSLDLLDDNGQPLAYTAVEFLDELPEYERLTIEVSAIFDKKNSRVVFGQAAMISRLRSISSCAQISMFLEKIDEVSNNLAISQDSWIDQPATWNSTCDVALIKRILEDGICKALVNSSSHSQGLDGRLVSISRFSEFKLSMASLQIRANHLTRELHILENAYNARSLEGRSPELIAPWPSHQHGEQRTRGDSDEVEVLSPSRGESYTEVEINESWLAAKRKHHGTSGVALEKKYRSI